MSKISPINICDECGVAFSKPRHCSRANWKLRRFCSRSCSGRWGAKNNDWSNCSRLMSERLKGMTGEKNYGWKGGRYTRWDGYVYIYKPDHPRATSRGYVFEHRYVVEQDIGRILDRKERVHHINGVKDDNRLENLKLFSSESEHQHCHLDEGTHTFNTNY